jgi:cysteine desulfurase/selenocysteine lyase
MPVMTHFGVPGTARASLGLYNTAEDVDRLVNALETARKLFA